jgi:hypothetical protein
MKKANILTSCIASGILVMGFYAHAYASCSMPSPIITTLLTPFQGNNCNATEIAPNTYACHGGCKLRYELLNQECVSADRGYCSCSVTDVDKWWKITFTESCSSGYGLCDNCNPHSAGEIIDQGSDGTVHKAGNFGENCNGGPGGGLS